MNLKKKFRENLVQYLFAAATVARDMNPSSPSSEYQKGFCKLDFSVGEAKLIEVRDDDNLTVDETDSKESYVLKFE